MSTIYLPSRDLPEGYGTFPVQCDEDHTLCAHCEDEKAMVRVSYERNNKSFEIDLCMECYSCPDFHELKSTYQNVKVKLI